MINMKRLEYIGIVVISLISLSLLLLLVDNINYVFFNLFIPMNTGIWEIGKLMFTSILIYSIVEYFSIGKKYRNFWFAKASSMLFGPSIYIFLSYFIDITIGISFLLTHIIVFVLSVGIAQYISYYFLEKELYFKLVNVYGVIAIITILTVFTVYNERRGTLHGPIFRPRDQYKVNIKSM